MSIRKLHQLFQRAAESGSAGANGEGRIPCRGFAVLKEKGRFVPYVFSRRELGAHDIELKILYAGICHTDLHHVAGDFGPEYYPMVPGHEIAGIVTSVGSAVSKFQIGDYAGVGCMVDSCGECEMCRGGHEQLCQRTPVFTYHGLDYFHDNEHTQGGYSDLLVLHEKFGITVPKSADLSRVPPLLCAGITTFAPLKLAGIGPGSKVAVAGVGGLGHMAVQYAHALGAKVYAMARHEDKKAECLELGADEFINHADLSVLEDWHSAFDFMIVAIPAAFDVKAYLKTLKVGGKMCIVGAVPAEQRCELLVQDLFTVPYRSLYTSQIGGLSLHQEMMDFSIAHNIYPKCEIIKASAAEIDKAFTRIADGRVHFRVVIDMQTLDPEDFAA